MQIVVYGTIASVSTDIRNVPLLTTLEMSPFYVVSSHKGVENYQCDRAWS
jgi:hypothetical protein